MFAAIETRNNIVANTNITVKFLSAIENKSCDVICVSVLFVSVVIFHDFGFYFFYSVRLKYWNLRIAIYSSFIKQQIITILPYVHKYLIIN